MKKLVLILLLSLFCCHDFYDSQKCDCGVNKEQKLLIEVHNHSEEGMEFCNTFLIPFIEKHSVIEPADFYPNQDDYSKIWKPPIIS